ncbi:hypothetical protein ILYODFUR_017750 [Ilyodon furcidens]|uniref:Uncharacterized protein n=1 Tax=Ilyodon furcidens TaxID=33524 RepID=A0ABV0USW1_9TELE
MGPLYIFLLLLCKIYAGTYHCALTSGGAVVFGEGTKVEILVPPPLLVYCLSVALILSILGLFVLSFLRYKLKSKLCSSCKGSGKHMMCSEALNATQENATESLHYVALNLKRGVEGQRQEENVDSACVYSRVRSRKE